MKLTIETKKEVEVKTLNVCAGVRYWDDATVNGKPDTIYGENVPCKVGQTWQPIIDLDTGKIMNWEPGKVAKIHYKVCDNGSYYILNGEGRRVLEIENDYVPNILCPKENGYGDYIIMDVRADGIIENWKVDLTEFNPAY